MISPAQFQNLTTRCRHLLKDDRGLSTVEYVIVLVLIAAVAMGAWNTFGNMVKEKLTGVTTDYRSTVTYENED